MEQSAGIASDNGTARTPQIEAPKPEIRAAAPSWLSLSKARRAILLGLASAAVLVAALWLLSRKNSPPQCARLLPESDAIVYFNLRVLRAATHYDRHPVPHDPSYQNFIDQTGIDVERDLNESAFALHRSPNPFGPNGPVAYSEVLSGRFDANRLSAYLKRSAQAEENYAGRRIYSIPSQGRAVRVCLLSDALVAVSNTPTAEQMHSMVERSKSAWLPIQLPWAAEPTLLATHYRDVPLLSLAWGLGQLGLPFADHGALQVLGLALPFRLDTTFVASIRWTGSLRIRLVQIAPSESIAAASAASLQSLIHLGQIAENNLPGALASENARALLNSATVTQAGDRTTLNAALPDQFLDRLLSPPGAPAK